MLHLSKRVWEFADQQLPRAQNQFCFTWNKLWRIYTSGFAVIWRSKQSNCTNLTAGRFLSWLHSDINSRPVLYRKGVHMGYCCATAFFAHCLCARSHLLRRQINWSRSCRLLLHMTDCNDWARNEYLSCLADNLARADHTAALCCCMSLLLTPRFMDPETPPAI